MSQERHGAGPAACDVRELLRAMTGLRQTDHEACKGKRASGQGFE